MKKIGFLILALCSLCLTSCLDELDNYDAPNGGIKGRILDASTGQPIPLPVQGSGGVIIRLYEQGTNASQSVDFYAKQDGTFENSQVFNCDYLVVAEGPFEQNPEGTVKVSGQTTFDLTATPMARIEASATASGRIVTINYKVTPSKANYQVSEVYGIWNYAPGVDNGGANQAGKKTVSDTSGSITFNLDEESNFKDYQYKIKSNGNKIYLRVGARTEGKINYSEVMEVTVN